MVDLVQFRTRGRFLALPLDVSFEVAAFKKKKDEKEMKVAGVLGNYRSLWSILSDFRRSIALLWVADSSILFWHSLQIRKQKKKGAHERTHYWTSRSKDCLHFLSSIVTIDSIDVGLLSLCFCLMGHVYLLWIHFRFPTNHHAHGP